MSLTRYAPEVDVETYCPDVEATMGEDSEGWYVEHKDVCNFLRGLLESDLDTLIEKIEEELKNA